MPAPVSITILALVAALVLVGMRRGWQRRTRRTGALVVDLPPTPPEGDGAGALGAARTACLEATYVSSTLAGDWLDRVAAHGLGVRSRATVQVFDAGVRIVRVGAPDVFVPAASLRAAETAPGIAGKFVGRDGIVVLSWTVGAHDDRGLDTGLHVRHAADRPVLLTAARTLIGVPAGANARDRDRDPASAEAPAPKEKP